MNTEQERAEFEAWLRNKHPAHALLFVNGRYIYKMPQSLWEAYQAGRAALQSQASGQSAADEIEGLRAHVALLKSALAQSERENDELRRAQPAAATAAPSDDEIEALAIKHIAPHHGKLVQAPYQRTEQFKRIKALILEVTARYGQAPAAAGDALDAVGRECLAVGRALYRAAGELPADGEIQLRIENGAGSVYWLDHARGAWRLIDSGETFSEQINSAIDGSMQRTTAREGE